MFTSLTTQESQNLVNNSNNNYLGELSIDIGKIDDRVEDKTVKLNIVFGDTHIIATTTNASGTEVKKCEFKFESS